MKKNRDTMNAFAKYINLDKDADPNPLPVLFTRKENCCGCTACYATCPVNAIQMRPDSEGFFYPVVDACKCSRCQKCLTVCRFKIDQRQKGFLA